MWDLVRTKTKDGLFLRGLYIDGDKNKPAVINIHGFQGDFFNQEFGIRAAKKLKENNFGFVSIQNRGTSIEQEVYAENDKGVVYQGCKYELLEEAYLDIDSWIEFLLDQGYKEIILQGHSLGTYKVVRYLFEGSHVNKIKKIVLLAPFDIMYFLKDFTKGKWQEYLKIAEQKVKDGKGREEIPEHYLDVKISYQTYVSHHSQNDLQKMFNFGEKSYDFPILNKIQLPVKILVGTKDIWFHPSNPENPEEAMKILLKNIKNSESKLIENSDHIYEGYEDLVAEEVLEFVKK